MPWTRGKWHPFWLKIIDLGDTNFTLSAPMTFVRIQSYIWFDKSGSQFTKCGSGSYKIPVNWEPLLRKCGSQFLNSYFFLSWPWNDLKESSWLWIQSKVTSVGLNPGTCTFISEVMHVRQSKSPFQESLFLYGFELLM